MSIATFKTLPPFNVRGIIFTLAAAFSVSAGPSLRADPIPVKVAVVVTFEVGADTGDQPGEFQFWAEREKWPIKIVVPGLDHPVLTDGKGTIGIVGGTTARAQSQMMALGLSGQFDFSRTYWLFNGISGVDPADASIGSAAWSRFVIDGDVAYEIDAREADPSWPYAIIPIGSKVPNERPKREGWEPDLMSYPLNSALTDWAYALTKDVPIPDTPKMAAYRALYVGYPNAQKPPFVLIGDSFGCSRYWHGKAMTQWANDWAKLWSDGKANFVMSDMEDQGFASAMHRLSKMGKVDFQRVMFLRTASNYCMQPPNMDVNQSMHSDMENGYAGYISSLEAAYRAGSKVVHELAGNWDKYRDNIPAPSVVSQK
jgi:purine nucleoside permease